MATCRFFYLKFVFSAEKTYRLALSRFLSIV